MYLRDVCLIAFVGTIRPIVERISTLENAVRLLGDFAGVKPVAEFRQYDGFWFRGDLLAVAQHLRDLSCVSCNVLTPPIQIEHPANINVEIGGPPFGPVLQLSWKDKAMLWGGFEAGPSPSAPIGSSGCIWFGSWVGSNHASIPYETSVQIATDDFDSALLRASVYARSIRREHFAGMFEAAITELLSEDGSKLVAHDLLPFPLAFPLKARRLLAAFRASAVWGGMGSWNDICPADDTYDAIASELYHATQSALTAALNTPLSD